MMISIKKVFSDPVMQALYHQVFDRLTELPSVPVERYFQDLCECVIGQQLSEKVAPKIVERVVCVVGDSFTPKKVLGISQDALRSAGVSNAKASYMKNIAQAWVSGAVDPYQLSALEDAEVIRILTQIKGIGRWTAEMFLIFTLRRLDVFSIGDYGLKQAILRAYQLQETAKPDQILALSEQWSPQRSLASRILWKSLEL